MKTFLECVKEAASVRNLKAPIKTLYFELPQELIETLKEAADMYATQSNSHKPVVGGPGSDVRSEGEQLGNEGSAKSVCGGLGQHDFRLKGSYLICNKCGIRYTH
jgi:hypothetical protein